LDYSAIEEEEEEGEGKRGEEDEEGGRGEEGEEEKEEEENYLVDSSVRGMYSTERDSQCGMIALLYVVNKNVSSTVRSRSWQQCVLPDAEIAVAGSLLQLCLHTASTSNCLQGQ